MSIPVLALIGTPAVLGALLLAFFVGAVMLEMIDNHAHPGWAIPMGFLTICGAGLWLFLTVGLVRFAWQFWEGIF